MQLIACSPDRLDDRALPLIGVDMETLRRLDATTLLAHTSHGIGFRHELARQAVESTIPPGGAPRLHQRLLESLEQLEPRDPAILTHHALAARDAQRTLTYARVAAAEAVAAASHTEAAEFLELALAHLPGSATALERAELLMQLSRQQYLTARLADAIASARTSIPLWNELGRQDGVAEAHAAMAVLEYQSGRRSPSNRHAARACEIAVELDAPAALGRTYADAAMLALIGSDLTRAVVRAERSVAAGTQADLQEFVVAGQMVLAGVDCFCGLSGGRQRVVELIDAARECGWDELAWRGYVILVVADLDHGDLRSAQRTIEETLLHSTARESGHCPPLAHLDACVRTRGARAVECGPGGCRGGRLPGRPRRIHVALPRALALRYAIRRPGRAALPRTRLVACCLARRAGTTPADPGRTGREHVDDGPSRSIGSPTTRRHG